MSAILSVIDDVERRLKVSTFIISHQETQTLQFKLRNLKLFVLSAKILGHDASLKSFLVRIENTVLRHAKLIHWRTYPVSSFTYDIDTLADEIHKWYITLMATPTELQPTSLTADEVLEIISSFLENFARFIRTMLRNFEDELGEAMEVLGDHMTFLKNLILFATQRNVKLREDLDFWAHATNAAVCAAFLLTPGAHKFHGGRYKEESGIEISTVVEKIKPVDPRVFEVYTKALSSSKSATRLLAPTNQGTDDDDGDEGLIATQNLLHSLIDILWDELRLNSRVVIHVKDQWQELYEGLRSLRKTLLKQKLPHNSDMKVKEDIVAAVSDAGILFCSLYQTHVETDFGLQDVLAAIRDIQAELGDKEPQKVYSFGSTNQLAYVDGLLEKLTEITSCGAQLTHKLHAQIMQEELVSLRSFLGEIVELRNEQQELQILWHRVLEVAYGVEYLIDYLVVDDPPYSFSTAFDLIMKDIKTIKPEIKVKGQEGQVNQVNMTHNIYVSSPGKPSKTKDMVGFHDEAKTIIDRLTRGSKELRIVAIVGMPGLGKTTLAERVYNDPYISYHFSSCAWITVSQTMDRMKVLLNLLAQVAPSKNLDITSKMTADDVAQELWRSLKRRSYLIVLDDIWDDKAWGSLQNSFPNDFVGSRIVLTSRRHNIARRGLPDEEPHELRPLHQNESLDLLQKQLFGGNGWPSKLVDVGMQIAKICNGLPLTIVIIAGFLKSTSPEGWKKLLAGLNSGNLLEQCRNTVELSYRHLSEHLRPCLLYFAAFPEDQQVPVRRLLRLWIAEGFVQKAEKKRPEDVAEEYLQELIGRSLIAVAEQRSIGGVKVCRIHDLVHEFCLQKSKDEQFFNFLEGDDELSSFQELSNQWRLCFRSRHRHLRESKIFCPRACSLIFNFDRYGVKRDISFMMHICKLLKVLDLEQTRLDAGVPSEIGLLVRLTFLAINCPVDNIPPSISNLYNLETFILKSVMSNHILPDALWNLRKLKYLHIHGTRYNCYAILPLENIKNSSHYLYELDRFSGLAIPKLSSMVSLMRRFPNIRQLKCELMSFGGDDTTGNVVSIVVPEFLTQLESLHMSQGCRVPQDTVIEFTLPENLKKLTLRRFDVSGRSLSTLGELPNLEVLKLHDVVFEGRTWRMEEEQFSKLKFLKLSSWNLRWWSASDYQFESLENLVLSNCRHLGEIPDCLESIPTLQMIKVSGCFEPVHESVRKIWNAQKELGNSDLKIIISH